MSFVARFERTLEGFVNATFARLFRSEVKPVELRSALERELDNSAQVLSRDSALAPNSFVVELSTGDHGRLAGYGETLSGDLAKAVEAHAQVENYTLPGRVTIDLRPADDLSTGRFRVSSQPVSTGRPAPAPAPPQRQDARTDTAASPGPGPVRELGSRRGERTDLRRTGQRPPVDARGSRSTEPSTSSTHPVSSSDAAARPTCRSSIPASPAGTPRSGSPSSVGATPSRCTTSVRRTAHWSMERARASAPSPKARRSPWATPS